MIYLIFVNGFNLLPLAPLDGGRLLQLAVFSRHPVLEVGFLIFASAGLGALSWIYGIPVLGIIAAFGALNLPSAYRGARQRKRLQAQFPGFSERLEDVSERETLVLFRLARIVQPRATTPRTCAWMMESIHEDIVLRPPSPAAAVGLVAAYGVSVAITVATLVLVT